MTFYLRTWCQALKDMVTGASFGQKVYRGPSVYFEVFCQLNALCTLKNVIEQSPHTQSVSTAKRLKVCNVQGASGLNRANSRRTKSHCTLFTSEYSRLTQSGSSGIVAFHPGMVESITSQVTSRDCLVNPLTMPSTAVTSGALATFRDALILSLAIMTATESAHAVTWG